MKNAILPEIISIGIFNAQLAIKNRLVSKNRKTTMFEIELPIEDGGVSYIDDDVRAISKNTVIVARPGQLRHTRLPFKCYYVHIIVKEGEIFDYLMNLPNFIEFKNTEKIHNIFVKLCENYGVGINENKLMIHSLLLELVYILNQHAHGSKFMGRAKNNNHAVIENTVEYIKNNLTSDLNLERLATEAKFTPTYFHKLFKASTGKNLHDYIEEIRIKKSINLLISTNMTLTQIAYECGFSSQSYFGYAFKRRMGTSPRRYAKSMYMQYSE